MLRNKLVRSDGSIIDSSVIISCEFTEEVNSNTNLSVGDVTSSELTVEILSTYTIQQDEVLTYSIIEDGVETKIGVFKAEKPTVATRTSMLFSAYDNVIKTEKIFSDWLRENQRLFPMPLITLVEYACSHCGVVLADTDFPQADLSVEAFYADGITCRQILAWAAAIAGRFVRANADGDLEFAWYADAEDIHIVPSKTVAGYIEVSDDGVGNVSVRSSDLTVNDDGAGNVTVLADGLTVTTNDNGITIASDVVIPFLQGKLSYESYTTDLIERVQINHSEDDVGIIYPVDATGNCFTISENMILGVSDEDSVMQIAADLYSHLKDITYVPFSVTVPRTIKVRAGKKIIISDSEGNSFISYVMKVAVTPSGTTLSATGDKYYSGNAAVSSEKYGNLTGKVLELSKSIDGLVIKNQDLTGKVGGLEVSVESVKTYVDNTFVTGDAFESYRSESVQTAQSFTQKFESLDQYRNDTEAYVKTGLLDDDGGQAVYGIQLGQETTDKDGVKTFNKFARFTSDRLTFFDPSGKEVAYFGDKKMFITNVEITGSADEVGEEFGTFKQGKFVDTALADGSIVSKWIGGA